MCIKLIDKPGKSRIFGSGRPQEDAPTGDAESIVYL